MGSVIFRRRVLQVELAAAKKRIDDLDREECLCCKATRWEHSPEQWAYCRSVIQGKMKAAEAEEQNPKMCTRADQHDGPCNGYPRAICLEKMASQ